MNLEKRVKTHERASSSEKFWKCVFSVNLEKCQTLKLHNRVQNAAQNLNDFNPISAQSEGNMLASDVKYHLNCLTSSY